MKLSPIILFVYNRPYHTKQTLEALMQNDLADASDLYIFCDGAKENATQKEKDSIKEVREIIRLKKWCGTIHINEAEKNIGLANSIIKGIGEVVIKYGKIIVLEDDIVTSNRFLKYMNSALNYYENYDQVAGISGFSYPTSHKFNSVYFLPIGSSWGWATWQRQWNQTNFDSKWLVENIESKKQFGKFDFGGFPFYKMLKDQSDGIINSWAIRFYASFFLQGKCFVFPPKSFVQNIGFDDYATHTNKSDGYMDKVIASNSEVILKDPIFNKDTLAMEESFRNKYFGGFDRKKKLSQNKSVRNIITLVMGFLRRKTF